MGREPGASSCAAPWSTSRAEGKRILRAVPSSAPTWNAIPSTRICWRQEIDRPSDAGRHRRRGPGRADARRTCCICDGIDSVIVENREPRVRHRARARRRARAGHRRSDARDRASASGSTREGLRHDGIYIAFDGARHRIDMAALTGGRAITVYGQNEVVERSRSTRASRRAAAAISRSQDVERARPRQRRRRRSASAPTATQHELQCDFIAGCDGFHGVCRPSIPAAHAAASTSATIRSPGSASSPRRRPRPTSSSTACTNAASRCSACARRRSRGSTCSARPTKTSPHWPRRPHLARAADAAGDARRVAAERGADHRRRA